MEEKKYPYVIIGGGLAGSSAIEGIRELDASSPILLVGAEKHLPYDRPPLSKKLWFGKKKVEDIYLHPREFYTNGGVTLVLGERVIAVDAKRKKIALSDGSGFLFEKLLLATGASPAKLPVSGASLEGVIYFRTLDDYLAIKSMATEGKTAVVIGGGFIGSEMAAALAINKVRVTMIFTADTLCHRVFPESLGRAMQERYKEHGVTVIPNQSIVSISKNGSQFLTQTKSGRRIESDLAIVGVGVYPETKPALNAGLVVSDGIVVNELLQSSDHDIFAAGDNALFSYQTLGRSMRFEHWDNALHQGKQAGRNMAGAGEPYSYMPYFFSDLFEFGYEAIGDIDPSLETCTRWQKENDTGIVYYMKNDRIRGVMMCNVWDKVEAARALIAEDDLISCRQLQEAL